LVIASASPSTARRTLCCAIIIKDYQFNSCPAT
jgi:hypothetical protein